MQGPIKVIDFALSHPIPTQEGLADYMSVQGLIRLFGSPIGYVHIPVNGDRCLSEDTREAILKNHFYKILQERLASLLAANGLPHDLSVEALLKTPHADPDVNEEHGPSVTVAICTRDRTNELPACLDALCQLDYPNLDLLLIDNAPTSDATRQLVQKTYPQIRYVCEKRAGLNWARNCAIAEARGEIIAYTDDDVVVDAKWIRAISRIFSASPEVMAVSGLVVPYELETKAQITFEAYGGFGRGFERYWLRMDPARRKKTASWYGGAGQFGTGANMAFRRSVFDRIGRFDPALDVGTITNGGGDLEMFFRVLKEGHTLVYEPRAIVRHRHRRAYKNLRTQITNNGIGLYSFWVRTGLHYGEERGAVMRLGLWWFWWWSIRRLIKSFLRPDRIPRDLILGELRGSLIGLHRYPLSRRKTSGKNEMTYGVCSTVSNSSSGKVAWPLGEKKSKDDMFPEATKNTERSLPNHSNTSVAIRTVELTEPLPLIDDADGHRSVRIYAMREGRPVGHIEVDHFGQPISRYRLADALASELGTQIMKEHRNPDPDPLQAERVSAMSSWCRITERKGKKTKGSYALPMGVSVSIVIATRDRPASLRDTLRSIAAQNTQRDVEVIVVDNHPSSGLTAPVAAEFPHVRVVDEHRQGLAYARNAGFLTSRGEIVIATDDDVIAPPDWLEKLVAPFVRNDVMIVTGNVFPHNLETKAEQMFEIYGGLGRGMEPFHVARNWFDSHGFHAVPTWTLGATANAAFRACIFRDPEIGLMDEALGPGTPSGVGEDTYLFYRVLKAGYTLHYAPSAYVWHKHRNTMSALRRQIYNYSKGHVAYHLTTFLRDHDLRGLRHVLLTMPRYHVKRLIKFLLGRSTYPMDLMLLEIAGNLAGPWTLCRSHLRVRRLGRSRLQRTERSDQVPADPLQRE